MKRLFTMAAIAALTFTCIVWQSFSRQGQLQSSSIGAPTEDNCNSCHIGSALNNPSGSITLSIAGNPSVYIPNHTYDITVTQTFNGRNRFGFAFSAKQQSNMSIKGSLSTNGNNNIQVLSGYMTHIAQGTTGTNSKSWSFKWTAPAANVGNIVLSAWGNAANNDITANGDFIYTTSKVLSFSTGIEPAEQNNVHVFPVPARAFLNIQLSEPADETVACTLMSLNGQSLTLETTETGKGLLHCPLPATLANGIYFLNIQAGNRQYTRKIVVN